MTKPKPIIGDALEVRLIALLRRERLLEPVSAVIRAHGVDSAVLVGPARRSSVSRVRNWVWWVLRDVVGLSWAQIGEMTNRDHSTVLAGVKCAKKIALAPLPMRTVPLDTPLDAAVEKERERIIAFLEVRLARAKPEWSAQAELKHVVRMLRNKSDNDPINWVKENHEHGRIA